MTPRRRFRRPYVAPPLDPATFVRRIAAKAGTDYGEALTRDAIGRVEESGDPDPWVRELQRARDAGSLGEDIAWFLIYQFVQASMFMISGTDPELHANAGEDPRYEAGRAAIFGPLEEFDAGDSFDAEEPR